jgi:AraC-like DNA-binding protein
VDVLSEAISGVRVGRAEACRVAQSGAWSLRYLPMNVSGFHVLVRGTAWLLTEGSEPRQMSSGDVVLIPAGTEHALSHRPGRLRDLPLAPLGAALQGTVADVEFVCGAYWLRQALMPPILAGLPDVILVPADDEANPHLGSLFALLEAHVADTDPGSAIARSALLDLLLTHILRGWLRRQHGAALPEVQDPAVAAALQRIHADPSRVWTVRQLGALAGMSAKTFTRLFTEVTGQSPGAYMSTWRLGRAARLLQETSAPLASIASQVGYATEFSFSAAFRRKYGIAPGRFRALPHAEAS